MQAYVSLVHISGLQKNLKDRFRRDQLYISRMNQKYIHEIIYMVRYTPQSGETYT